jgi:site-specific DNA-methyltransferase (adenine-specific)
MASAGKILNIKAEKFLLEAPSECIDLTVTSPPYDDLRSYNSIFDLDIICKELYRATKNGGVCVWVVSDATKNGSETGTSFKQALKFMECGWNLHDTMIYEKSGMAYPDSNRYHQVFEYMFVFSKGKPKTTNIIKDRPNKYVGTMGGNKRGGLCKRSDFGARFNIWRYNNGRDNSSKDRLAFKHPAIMPEQLAADHITTWSNEGDLVCDIFMGSGTTAKMAKLANRNYTGCEMEEKYFEIIEQRLNETLF